MAAIETPYKPLREQDLDLSHFGEPGFSIISLVAKLERQLEKRRSRMALLEMSDDQLKDIALSRADAYREANRKFWD